MLVIAIPKSASTALMKTLAARHGLRGQQVMFPENPVPDEYRLLGTYHSDVRTLAEGDLASISGEAFFKQHVPPTAENLGLLSELPKVVLLREPEEIVRAYRRAQLTKLHAERPEFAGATTETEWIERADRIGLLDELHRWFDGWMQAVTPRQVIRYSELVADPDAVVRHVEQCFALTSASDPVRLVRARYSREQDQAEPGSPIKSAFGWVRRKARRMLG